MIPTRVEATGGRPDSSTAVYSLARPEEVVTAALEAWSQFASLGDPASLSGAFFVGGPQYEQLAGEGTIGDPPIWFDLEETVVRSRSMTSVTIWARVRVEREGYRSEELHWDFDLVPSGNGWLVWTVVPAERPVEMASSSSAAITTETIRPSLSQSREGSSPNPDAIPNRSKGVRLPAVSAWIIVITIAGVAFAGYLAPRIDRRRER